MPQQGPRSQDNRQPAPSLRWQVFVLAAILTVLASAIATSSGGIIEFFQSISEERNLISISILAGFIGVLFVLLHRVGVVLTYENEIDPSQSNSP